MSLATTLPLPVGGLLPWLLLEACCAFCAKSFCAHLGNVARAHRCSNQKGVWDAGHVQEFQSPVLLPGADTRQALVPARVASSAWLLGRAEKAGKAAGWTRQRSSSWPVPGSYRRPTREAELSP